MDTANLDNSSAKDWDSDSERLDTEIAKFEKRQRAIMKNLRKRIDNLTVLMASTDLPCRKDLASYSHHLGEAQIQLKLLYRATLDLERLGRAADAKSAIAIKRSSV